MFAAKTLLTLAATALLSNASPTGLQTRQDPPNIPDNYIFVTEWFPNGCGNGDATLLYGAEQSLAACQNFNSLLEPDDPDSASIRFTFPEDDDREFKWKLFNSQDCSEQVAEGSGDGCYSVPTNQAVGAVIVYT